MRFIYVIPVYNEGLQINELVSRLAPFLRQNPGSLLLIVDNGSQDDTWKRIQNESLKHQGIVEGYQVGEKGQGLAFRRAMQVLEKRGLPDDSWVVFSACDLPFDFTDVEWILRDGLNSDLVVGSKAHPRSHLERTPLRRVMSFVYLWSRKLFLGMRTRDPQGSLIFRPKWLKVHASCRSKDFFLTTEVVYQMERAEARVLEVPIRLNKDRRASKVNPIKDGLKVFKQIIRFALANGRLKSKADCRFHP